MFGFGDPGIVSCVMCVKIVILILIVRMLKIDELKICRNNYKTSEVMMEIRRIELVRRI